MIQPPCAEGAVNLQSIISQSTSSTKMIVKSTLATHPHHRCKYLITMLYSAHQVYTESRLNNSLLQSTPFASCYSETT